MLTGTPSVFVRASGCNLRCWYCDTPYASWSPEGEDLSVPEALERIDASGASHVVLTGGEPMLFAELIPLTQGLRQRGIHITIETAGTLDLPVACDLMSISPKLAGSAPSREEHPYWHRRHHAARHVPPVIRRLVRDYPYQMKFVVDTRDDCQEVARYLEEFPEIEAERVWLMPQGTETGELAKRGGWLEPLCQERGWKFCPRRQIEWYGPVRGT